jgi:hypothetical protein
MDDLLEGWLNDETLTLRKLERALLALVMGVVRRLLVIFLERLDRQLQRSRDKSRYELRGRAGRDVETLVGAVRFKRRRYMDRQEGRDIYLLDERLRLAKPARVSEGVVETGVSRRQDVVPWRARRAERVYGLHNAPLSFGGAC